MTADEIADAVSMRLLKWGMQPIREYQLPNGRRLDVAAIGKYGRLLGVEIKTTESDFNRDRKWADVMSQCFIFYFAVPLGFNVQIIHPGIRLFLCEGVYAWVGRRTGRGLTDPHKWHEAPGRYAVNPAAGVDPSLEGAKGDSARGRLWMP